MHPNELAQMHHVWRLAYEESLQGVYLEGVGNDAGAVEHWRNALDRITEAPAAFHSGKYQPSANEKDLFDSLSDLEKKCLRKVQNLDDGRLLSNGHAYTNGRPHYQYDYSLEQFKIANASAPSLILSPGSADSDTSSRNSSFRRKKAPPAGASGRKSPRTPSPEKKISPHPLHTRRNSSGVDSKPAVPQAESAVAASRAAALAWGNIGDSSKPRAGKFTKLRPERRRHVTTGSQPATIGQVKPPVNGLKQEGGTKRYPTRSSMDSVQRPSNFSDDLISLSTPTSVPSVPAIPRAWDKLNIVDQPTNYSSPSTAADKEKQPLKPSSLSRSYVEPGASKPNPPKPRRRPSTPAKEQKITLEAGPVAKVSNDLDDMKMDSKITTALKNLKGKIDDDLAKTILREIVVRGDEVHWDDIAGLEGAKRALKETVVYPFLRPDLFSGLREPARGMLLFGPPGTGKTMLARAVATESHSTFFSISASSLTSKYLGESEKLVRSLFTLAKELAPSIIFVDEIDSLLSSRNEGGEHEASRRLKTEFLIQWSALASAAAFRESQGDAQRVLVLAATNIPWAIDEGARRRFVRRQYIPLPEPETREKQLSKLLSRQNHTLGHGDLNKLITMTESYSGSDITALAKDAAMGPLRSLGEALLTTAFDHIRPIELADFQDSMLTIRPSVGKEGLKQFEEWASQYGSSGA